MSCDKKEKESLPSRYGTDHKGARWRRMWLNRGMDNEHIDDDGADPEQNVSVALPPLPNEYREVGKNDGRPPINERAEDVFAISNTLLRNNCDLQSDCIWYINWGGIYT